MTDPRKDIEGLQREMDETRADVQKVQKLKPLLSRRIGILMQ